MAHVNWIYTGFMGHQRVHVRKHGFKYPSYYFSLDVSQLSQASTKLFKFNGWSLFSINSKDYLRGEPGDLDVLLRRFLKNHELSFDPQKIELQTNPRVLGYVFNPVSFWYLYINQNEIGAVLVEVNNTFGERHFYLLDYHAKKINLAEEFQAKKVFHVSPFFDLEGFYKFRFIRTPQKQKTVINYFGNDEQLRLSTWIEGQPTSLTDANLLKIFFKFGWMTAMVILRIHWQALFLWIKKIQFYKKPQPPTQELTR